MIEFLINHSFTHQYFWNMSKEDSHQGTVSLHSPSEPAINETNVIDAFYLLFSGYLVFFMQCGFCMVNLNNCSNLIKKIT